MSGLSAGHPAADIFLGLVLSPFLYGLPIAFMLALGKWLKVLSIRFDGVVHSSLIHHFVMR